MPHGHGHAHDHFRAGDVDWAGLADRQRARLALAEAYWDLLGRPVGGLLADVGCGPGVLAVRYAELGARVLAVDLRADALARVPAHPRVRTLAHDLEAAPLPERVDDLVLSEVLHHARRPDRMLAHARASADRILVAEYDPAAAGDVGPPLDVRIAPAEVARLLRAAGFEAGTPSRAGEEEYVVVSVS